MNKAFKIVVIILAGLSLAACAAVPKGHAPNPRIVERDLTKPYPTPQIIEEVQPAPEIIPLFPAQEKANPIEKKPEVSGSVFPETEIFETVVASAPVKVASEAEVDYFIEFGNETIIPEISNQTAETIIKNVVVGKDLFIVGHSHGKSRVGNEKLATGRADAVAEFLLNEGVNSRKIHTLASWSNKAEIFAPSRGVQVFFVDSSDPSKVLILLSRLSK